MTVNEALDLLNNRAKVKDKILKGKLKKWTDVYYGISLHTTGACPYFIKPDGIGKHFPPGYISEHYQLLFDYRLMNKHPNEMPESRWYRYSIYRPLTKSPFSRAIQVLSGAIFQDSNYSIEIPDEKDRDYLYSNVFYGNDLIGYLSSMGIKHIIEDPNGFFIRMPSKPMYEQTGERIEVGIYFVNTKDLVWISENDLLYKTGDCLHAYYVDKQSIWRFTLNEKGQYEVTPEDSEGYYAHMLGYLPITVAGGEWNTHGYYDSYMDNAKALCDEFVSTFSAAQVVDKEASHPFIVAAQDDCLDCNGLGKTSICNDCRLDKDHCHCSSTDYTRFSMGACSTCGGSGTQSKNPMQWIRVPREDLTNKVDHIKFVSPDIGINKHHREVIDKLTEQILQSLHLYRTDKAESGEAKAIDQEWLYQFLMKISNHIFDKIIYDTIRDIIAYRNVSSEGGVLRPAVYDFTIIKPNQFRIKTATDLLEEYKTGQESGLPVIIRDRMVQDFTDKSYWGDNVLIKKSAVSSALDPNYTRTVDELMSLATIGAITLDEVKFTQKLPLYLNRVIEDKGEKWFIAADIVEIQKLIDTYKPKPNGLINGLSQGEE